MIVTDVTEFDKKRVKIFLDGEFAFVLYKGELSSFGIKQSELMPEEVYQEIMQEVLPKRAKLRCMNLLTKRSYTTRKLEEKLREGLYPSMVIEEAIAYVTSYHYLDDDRYALEYVESYRESRSRERIRMDLLRKGIDQECFEKAWEEAEERSFTKREETDLILQLLQKKHYDKRQENSKEEQKIIGFLLRKGFRYEDIRSTLKRLT